VGMDKATSAASWSTPSAKPEMKMTEVCGTASTNVVRMRSTALLKVSTEPAQISRWPVTPTVSKAGESPGAGSMPPP